MLSLLSSNIVNNYDTPKPWGLYFQDSSTSQMEGLVGLHDNIMFYLVIILFGVGWIMISIVRNYTSTKSFISHKYLNHGTLIELIWTITPALILILIAFPSFKLLYLMDEVSDPAMSVLAEGHQWYWSYQYPDFLNADDEFIEFDSYLIPELDLDYINCMDGAGAAEVAGETVGGDPEVHKGVDANLGDLPIDYTKSLNSVRAKMQLQFEYRCRTVTSHNVYSKVIPVEMQMTTAEEVALHQHLLRLHNTYILTQDNSGAFKLHTVRNKDTIKPIARLIADLNKSY